MKIRLIRFAAVALLACTSQVLRAQDAPQPQPQPLPTVEVSTLLFQLFVWGGSYADTADPIDVNAFDIDFGDDSDGNSKGNSNGNSDNTSTVVNELLQSN